MRNRKKREAFKNAVVAIQPIKRFARPSPNLNIFANIIKKFQNFKLLPSVTITSMINNSMYAIPNAWYFNNVEQFAAQTKNQIEIACKNKFNFRAIHILKAESSSNSELVEELSDYLKKIKSNLLVVLSSDRSGLPYYLLGSFAETATLSAPTSLLVIKPHVKNVSFSTRPRLTLALDPTIQYSRQQMMLIATIAAISKARVNIISVYPNYSDSLLSLTEPKKPKTGNKELKKFAQFLNEMGISTSVTFVKQNKSIAKTIINFADQTKSWAIITLSVERKLTRRIFIGSTARRILTLTKRPFFSLR